MFNHKTTFRNQYNTLGLICQVRYGVPVLWIIDNMEAPYGETVSAK